MLDVLIPVYNAEETLDDALSTVANQTFSDFRVIAVDDGSTDGSAQILRNWAERDARFTVVSKSNGGIVDALNFGLQRITGRYLARFDADDLAMPERFARQVRYLDEHPECVGVGCGIRHFDEGRSAIEGLPQPGPPEAADMDLIPAREPYIVHPFLTVRTDALQRVGGYRYVPHSEDSDLLWRLAELGRLHNLPEVLGAYRMHMESISGSSILNGRIMAVGSQLGAHSARRRRAHRRDFDFRQDLVATLREAGSLDAMCRIVSKGMEGEEVPRFRLSVAIKLMELANYRPYEVEAQDCLFISSCLDKAGVLASARNRADIDWYLSRTGSRLVRSGHMREAMTLVPPRLWPKTAVKCVLAA